MVPSRLDKYMSDATSLSRSQIRKAWSDGKIEVCVGGEVEARVIALDTLIFEEDQVFFEQTRVERRVPSVYAAFCKPMGVISSARREKGQRSLAPWLEELGEGVFPIGRLEQDTVGLMLLTDDGDLSHVMTQPDVSLVYKYRVHVDLERAQQDEIVTQLSAGVELSRELRVIPVNVAVSEVVAPRCVIEIEIEESRSKQIRSMCHVLGLVVQELHRVAIGPIELGDMIEGDVRRLGDEEVTELWRLCGGRARVRERRCMALARLARKHRDEGEPHERLESWLEKQGISFDEGLEGE